MNSTQTTVSRAAQIDHIMEHFDFAKVERTMKLLDWTWISTAPYTPDVEALRSMACYLLNTVDMEANTHEGSIKLSAGGLRASIDAHGEMNLSFVVTDWDASAFCASKENNHDY